MSSRGCVTQSINCFSEYLPFSFKPYSFPVAKSHILCSQLKSGPVRWQPYAPDESYFPCSTVFLLSQFCQKTNKGAVMSEW